MRSKLNLVCCGPTYPIKSQGTREKKLIGTWCIEYIILRLYLNTFSLARYIANITQGVPKTKLLTKFVSVISGDQIFQSKRPNVVPIGPNWPKRSKITLLTQSGPKILSPSLPSEFCWHLPVYSIYIPCFPSVHCAIVNCDDIFFTQSPIWGSLGHKKRPIVQSDGVFAPLSSMSLNGGRRARNV